MKYFIKESHYYEEYKQDILKDSNKKGSIWGIILFVVVIVVLIVLLKKLENKDIDLDNIVNKYNTILSLVGGIGLILIGIGLSYITIIERYIRWKRCCDKVEAEIYDIMVEESSDADGKTFIYHNVYRYYHNGLEHKNIATYGEGGPPDQIRKRVQIGVNPKNSKEIFEDKEKSWNITIMASVFGIMFIVLGIRCLSRV